MGAVYVVTAYRWGDRNDHSYVVGAFSDLDESIKTAEQHCTHRGGKYKCAVDHVVVDYYDDDDDSNPKEVYKTK